MGGSNPSTPSMPAMPKVKKPAPLATTINDPLAQQNAERAAIISQSKKEGRQQNIATSGTANQESQAGNTPKKKKSRSLGIAESFSPVVNQLGSKNLLGD